MSRFYAAMMLVGFALFVLYMTMLVPRAIEVGQNMSRHSVERTLGIEQ